MLHFRFKFKKCFTAIALIATVFMITIIFLPYLGEDALMCYSSLSPVLLSLFTLRWHYPGESGIHGVAVCSELHPARRLCDRGSGDTSCFWTGTLWGHLWSLLQPLPSPYGCKLDFEGMIWSEFQSMLLILLSGYKNWLQCVLCCWCHCSHWTDCGPLSKERFVFWRN